MIKKKSLGQNFLKSPKIIADIVSAGKVTKEDLVLEIGPGEGVMTEQLLLKAEKVIVIEKDHRLIPVLQEKFKNEVENGKLQIIEADILDIDLMSRLNLDIKGGYKIISNIPYYITGQIIRKFLEAEKQPASMTLLVQKEVAERIVARDGKESLLSLSVKIFGNPKIIRKVPRGAFSPIPNVDSAVINIENISKNKLGELDSKLFFEVLHAGFAHKRKQLLPNLLPVLVSKGTFDTSTGRERVESVFKKLGIDLKVRAEDVTLENWLKLTKLLVI